MTAHHLKKAFRSVLAPAFPLLRKMRRSVWSARWRVRVSFRRVRGKKIKVIYLIHSPQIANKIAPVINLMVRHDSFDVLVVGMKYRHSVARGEFIDDNAYQFLRGEYGERAKDEEECGTQELRSADYVFVQTPYGGYKQRFLFSELASRSRICYVPYHGPMIYRGEVERATKPKGFAERASFIFEHPLEKKTLHSGEKSVFSGRSVLLGSPVLETIDMTARGPLEIKRILWTPRWRTSEGNCSFFDQIEMFLGFCKANPEVQIKLRAHPLFFMNLQTTGELSKTAREALEYRCKELGNFVIDNSGELGTELRNNDLFISDMSSILFELVATAKPIIYIHKVNSFNELGEKIAAAFYWATTPAEILATIDSLNNGFDELEAKRRSVAQWIRVTQAPSPSRAIRDFLISDYRGKVIYGS